MITEEEERRI
jgi:hypothetical protein